MTATLSRSIRRRPAAALLTVVALAALTGCSMPHGVDDTVPAVAASSSSPVTSSVASGTPVVLRFGDHAVAATLADTAASRDLAGMLPLTLELSDAWGQAKSGQLPRPVPVEGAARTMKPTPGGIYYWPDDGVLAVYYDDLGQSVPPPGLIRLGDIDTGVDELAGAGRKVTVRIDRLVARPAPDLPR